MNIPPTLSNSLPFTSSLLYMWCLCTNWVEKLIWELGSHFSILWPLNKACALPVSASASLLAAWIQSEKEPRWLRQGVSVWARTPAWVWSTSWVTSSWEICLLPHLLIQLFILISLDPWVFILFFGLWSSAVYFVVQILFILLSLELAPCPFSLPPST